jgi:nickel-dependent lactate racemase
MCLNFNFLKVCRYCVKHKNDQQPGWEIVYTCGGCDADDWIEEAFNAWRVANKTQIFVGRISLTPSNVSRKIAEFKARNLRTLQLHPAQIVRFMCLQGSYVLSAEMVATGAITISACIRCLLYLLHPCTVCLSQSYACVPV